MKRKITELEKEAAEDWANKILDGEEVQSKLNKEFLDYAVYGKSVYFKEKDGSFEPIYSEEVEKFLSNPDVVSEDYDLDVDSIVNKFSDSLSADELEKFKKYEK